MADDAAYWSDARHIADRSAAPEPVLPPRVVALLPARLASTRFPNKPLADETGKPMIQHVYERTRTARTISEMAVATSDQAIHDAVTRFGGFAVMTRDDHPNGTSRIAEAVAAFPDAEIIVNVQGDEPEIEPAHIDLAVEALVQAEPEVVMSTLATPFAAEDDPADPNLVKVVIDQRKRALLFTRQLIPWDREHGSAFFAVPRRDANNGKHHVSPDHDLSAGPYRHAGLYVYRRAFLLEYIALAPTPLERIEALEQLRVLEHGYRMAVAVTDVSATGIDTPEQYAAFVARWQTAHGKTTG